MSSFDCNNYFIYITFGDNFLRVYFAYNNFYCLFSQKILLNSRAKEYPTSHLYFLSIHTSFKVRMFFKKLQVTSGIFHDIKDI